MLRFQDDEGVEWEVREIADPTLAIIPQRHLIHPEYATGWLLFESPESKRRLAPIPLNWEALDRLALIEHCRVARPAGLSRKQ